MGYSKRGSRYELGGWIGRDVMDNGSIFINQEEVKENRDILKSTFRTVLCIQYLEYRVGKGSHRRRGASKKKSDIADLNKGVPATRQRGDAFFRHKLCKAKRDMCIPAFRSLQKNSFN